MNRLIEIFEHKRQEVAAAKTVLPPADLRAKVADCPPTKGFRAAIAEQASLALIAEVKRASPSMGMIRPNIEPVQVALEYLDAGATCLSVLTDEKYFGGSPENLRRIREAVDLPLLRKDFVDDPYQIDEARMWGADAILLIVASLSPGQIADLSGHAKDLGLDVLVEVHDEAELEVANELRCDLIGVNNRNLATFETKLETSIELLPRIHPGAIKVSESALGSHDHIQAVRAAGADAVLIGTTFCAAPDIRAKVREVMGT